MPTPVFENTTATPVVPQEPDPRTANPGVYFYPDRLKLLIPKAFDPDNFLAPYKKLQGYRDHLCWWLSKIINLHNYRDLPPTEYVNISQRTLREHIHPNYCKDLQLAALEQEIVECDRTWRRTEKSMGWRLGPALRNGIKTVTISNPALIAKIVRNRIRVSGTTVPRAQLSFTHAGLLHWQEQITIDRDLALQLASNRAQSDPNKLQSYERSIDRLHEKEWELIVDGRQGRVYTPITNLFSEARTALRINGNPLGSIDIKNSQMIFFCTLMLRAAFPRAGAGGETPPLRCTTQDAGWDEAEEEAGAAGKSVTPKVYNQEPQEDARLRWLTQDQRHFWDLTMEGRLYDFLLGEHNEAVGPEQRISTREEFKPALFRAVFFGNNDLDYASLSDLALVFRANFPTVWNFITDQKTGVGAEAWKNLAIEMQRAESSFMIDKVCYRLLKYHNEVPIVTIHDSIMTTPEHLALVERVIREEFWRMAKINPALHIKQPNPIHGETDEQDDLFRAEQGDDQEATCGGNASRRQDKPASVPGNLDRSIGCGDRTADVRLPESEGQRDQGANGSGYRSASMTRTIRRPEIGTPRQIAFADKIISRFEYLYPEAIEDLSEIEIDRLGRREAVWWINNQAEREERFRRVSLFFRNLRAASEAATKAAPVHGETRDAFGRPEAALAGSAASAGTEDDAENDPEILALRRELA